MPERAARGARSATAPGPGSRCSRTSRTWHELTVDRLGRFMDSGEPPDLDEHEDAINARAARAATGRTTGEIVQGVEDSYRRLHRQVARLTRRAARRSRWLRRRRSSPATPTATTRSTSRDLGGAGRAGRRPGRVTTAPTPPATGVTRGSRAGPADPHGVRLSQAVSVAASLGIADALADGPRSADDIAAAVGGDPTTTYRLLRTLAAGGILHEAERPEFSLTDLGVALRSDVAGSVRDQAIIFGKPYMLAAWGNLEHSIRTGENAFTALHGEDVWACRARDPEEQSDFNRAMASASAPVGPALAAAYDFDAIGTARRHRRRIRDAARGGPGGASPGCGASCSTSPRSSPRPRPSSSAPASRTAREVVGGDFFASVPAADAYVMKAILHDWSDADSIRILRTIRAPRRRRRLLIVERVLGGPNDDLDGKLMDLHMLVMPGGLERTLDEWRDLFAAGGWTLTGHPPDRRWLAAHRGRTGRVGGVAPMARGMHNRRHARPTAQGADRQARPRRPRPRRQGARARPARRGLRGRLHGPPPDAGHGRDRGDAGGRRRRRACRSCPERT